MAALQDKVDAIAQDSCTTRPAVQAYPDCARYVAEVGNAALATQGAAASVTGADALQATAGRLADEVGQFSRTGCVAAPGVAGPPAQVCGDALQKIQSDLKAMRTQLAAANPPRDRPRRVRPRRRTGAAPHPPRKRSSAARAAASRAAMRVRSSASACSHSSIADGPAADHHAAHDLPHLRLDAPRAPSRSSSSRSTPCTTTATGAPVAARHAVAQPASLLHLDHARRAARRRGCW